MEICFFFQCACRWILRHQHKLRQATRSCYLNVKEAAVGNLDERQYDYEEYTFKVNNWNIIVIKMKS